jgi:hypothetical protein
MKKLLLSVMFAASATTISNSQTIDDAYSCVNPLYNTLTSCFSTNDVTGRYSGGGNTLYFQADAGVQYNQLSGCVDNYNKDRVYCPTAPLLILGTSQKAKKTVL